MAKQKTILVTGGAGFIGSSLIEELVKDLDNIVISLDNYFTGTEENHVDGAKYVKGHTKDIEKHIQTVPDIIYHLGEYSRVEKSLEEPDIVWDLNKEGTFRVLEFCRKHNVKLVYAGSSTKFGDGGLGRIQSPYAWTKASNTELISNYGRWFGLTYAITYFYNVYGPREISTGPYATIIGIFKKQFELNRPLTVVSPGTQTRNFTNIEDIVRGLLLVGEKGEGDEYGLGNEKSYSVLDIAKLFGGKISFIPERRGNRMDSSLDLKKMHALDWSAERGVEEYIKDLVDKRIPSRKI